MSVYPETEPTRRNKTLVIYIKDKCMVEKIYEEKITQAQEQNLKEKAKKHEPIILWTISEKRDVQ